MTKELTHKQQKFLQALLVAPTISKASETAEISTVTAYRYMRDLKFRRAYREHTSQLMQQTTAKLQSASLEAVDVLHEIMTNKKSNQFAKIQAAQAILTMAFKGHELNNVIEIIEELEAKVEEVN